MKGFIFDIQRCSVSDGPGVRTTVFLKGCPLSCIWCHNPESQQQARQLMFRPERCIHCGLCAMKCSNHVHQINPERQVNFAKCKFCMACVNSCPQAALKIAGYSISVKDLLRQIKKDAVYYQTSGGGITVSGGEPTMQYEFVLTLCKALRNENIHVALDTCGHTPWNQLKNILRHTDLVLFDIKHMDPVKHNLVTGVNNYLILNNFRNIVNIGIPIQTRLPLIPGINNDEAHLRELAAFLLYNRVYKLELVPYHALGINKYKSLGMVDPGNKIRSGKNDIADAVHVLNKMGLTTKTL